MIKLKAKKREITGKKVQQLRDQGEVPAVVYGAKPEYSINLTLTQLDAKKLREKAGSSDIISLNVEGEEEPREVLMKEVIMHPIKEVVLHVDFYQFLRGQAIDANVVLEFVGEAPIEKDGGIVNKALGEVSVRALPKDLPSNIQVDISELKEFTDMIMVEDLKIPENVELLTEAGNAVVTVSEPRKIEEEEPASVVEGEEGQAVEGEEEGEKSAEGEAGAEDKLQPEADSSVAEAEEKKE